MQQELVMFKTLFQGLSRAHTTVKLLDQYEEKKSGGRKRKATVYWQHEDITEKHYSDHLTGECGLGITPVTDAGTCFFGVIDIDDYVWSENRLRNICHRIEQLKFPLMASRSKSGGVRLYAFCEESPAYLMIRYLRVCAATLGFPKAEIFPKTENLVTDRKDVGHAITLPYFGEDSLGFNAEGPISLTEFLRLALSKLCKTTALQNIPGLNLEGIEEFSDGPPCLQALSINGFPEGGRANGLFNVGVYLRLKHSENGPARYLEEYHRKYISPELEPKEVKGLIKSLSKKEYWYRCKEEPIHSVCNRELCLTRKFGVSSGNGESNIQIDSITKLDTKPPLWLFRMNNRSIEMETEDFASLQPFIKICIEHLHLIPNVTATRLKHMIQSAMSKGIEVIEAPPDASLAGQCLLLFHQYLQSKVPAKTKSDIVYGAPWYEDGYVYFRGKDFTDFLDMEHFRKLDCRKVWSVLREYNMLQGGEDKGSVSIRVNDRVVKVRAIKYDKPQFVVQDDLEDF